MLRIDRMKKSFNIVLILFSILILSGCLYPNERLAKNQVPHKNQVDSVQRGVDDYQERYGVLPIKTRDMSTSIYQKYPIDFSKLMKSNSIQGPPGNAFENGGTYQYVLVNVETDPEIKLIDLVTVDRVQDLQTRLNTYRQKHEYPPVKKVLANGRYLLDHEKLGMEEPPFVRSPFTGKNLPLIMNSDAEVFIDYSIDLYEAMQNQSHSYEEGDDIRDLLVKDSFFVPVYSVPYTVKDNEPVFLLD
jgi:hypothetical protein